MTDKHFVDAKYILHLFFLEENYVEKLYVKFCFRHDVMINFCFHLISLE